MFPALAYTLDLNLRTNGQYGVNETILVTAIAALAFSIFSVQPLTIVGVTGLIVSGRVSATVFEPGADTRHWTAELDELHHLYVRLMLSAVKTRLMRCTDDIVTQYDVNYLQFMGWVCLWSAITHWLTAIFNLCDYTRIITDMTSETFGLYVGVIYIIKGVEVLVFEFDEVGSEAWFSVVVAILFAVITYLLERVGSQPFGRESPAPLAAVRTPLTDDAVITAFWFRKGIQDYAFVITIIFFTGFTHIPGYINSAETPYLPVTETLKPTLPRSWVVDFWNLEVKWVFIALPFGCLITLLFYFDNNVSSIMCQSRAFPIKRPSGFHWDFFLLGCTTFVAGLLGLPAPNGLVPQAPIHTESLCVVKQVPQEAETSEGGFLTRIPTRSYEKEHDEDSELPPRKVLVTRVVEQRVTHFAMGMLSLGTISAPLLTVLGLCSNALFSGIFFVVGWGSIEGNGIVHKTLFLLREPRLTPPNHHLRKVRKRQIAKFVGIQWFFFAATIAISQTIGAIGFPVVITALIPLRHILGPRLFTPEELAVLDAPTADSAAVLVSIGGDLDDAKARSEAGLGTPMSGGGGSRPDPEQGNGNGKDAKSSALDEAGAQRRKKAEVGDETQAREQGLPTMTHRDRGAH